MYQEWMDAIPLLVPGCPRHNAAQLARAEEYYKNHNDYEEAKRIHKEYLKEMSLIK